MENTVTQSKREERWELKNSEEYDGTCGQVEVVSLQAGHGCGYRAVKSEAENPIVKSGKSEEESNMATPRPVRKRNWPGPERRRSGSIGRFGNTNNKGVDRAMFCATYWR